MESTIVIKVKYGETLRRFNALVNEAGQLVLDLGGLREKVLDLFSFAPDADIALTYIDEDGDVVTLVDEEDLCDVMRQSLNPLRITVKLNAEKGGRFYAVSSGKSTPMRSPRVQYPLPNLNSSISEILKSVPEPFHEGLSKLSLDLASKAASSAPGLAELVDCLSKIGQSYVSPVSELQAATEPGTQSGASGSVMGASMTKEPEASRDEGATSKVTPNAKFEKPTSKTKQKGVLVNNTRDVDALIIPASGSLNLNDDLPVDSFISGSISTNLAPVSSQHAVDDSDEEVKKFSENHLSGKADNSVWVNHEAVPSSVPANDNNREFKKSAEGWNSLGTGASPSTADNMRQCIMDSKTTNLGGSTRTEFPILNLVFKKGEGWTSLVPGASSSTADTKKHSTMDSKTTSLGGRPSTKFPFPNLNLGDECPFTRIPVANDSAVPYMQYGSRVHPFKRSYNHSDGMGSIFHRGVRCDGCGVHPITGPRFKSKVKENYDLCSICFSEMGNDADYIRMDRPVSYRHPCSFKGFYDPMQYPRVSRTTLPHGLRGCGMKPSRPKLDSRFIMDVNVLDGTIMAPTTPFTKIWRMRNNGTIVWPQGTQLVWIGGDKLSDALSVELQISANGLPVENELDIAADFIAPELPGRYISYWRMASPSGQKFGQRVWVLIQVDASLKDSLCESFLGLNLNLPPAGSGITGPESINVNVEPMVVEDSLPEPDNSDRATELVEPLVDARPTKDQELNFPINDTLLVGGSVSNTIPAEVPTSVSYPIIDLSEVAPAVPSHAPSPSTDAPLTVQGASENNDVEQTLLRELEEMGFKQVNLNKEILRMNEYDLEQSVDDLCGVAEWDPMLEELQEMGFHDNEVNKRLLKKNNGSIKRVVMDLITGEKALSRRL